MKSTPVWLPFAFSAALSAIVLVTYIASGNPWIIPFLCFLPMTFWFATILHRQTREHIKALEGRIQQLEAGKAAASP